MTFTVQSQTIINFQDSKLKEYLIDKGFDSNNDLEIDTDEALAVTTMKHTYVLGPRNLVDLAPFTNLISIVVGENSSVYSIEVHNLPSFKKLEILGSGVQVYSLKNLPEMTELDMMKPYYLRDVYIENTPTLTTFNSSVGGVDNLTIIDAPGISGYSVFGTPYVHLKNTGAPKDNRLSFGSSIDVSGSRYCHVENIAGLNEIGFFLWEDVDTKIIHNLDLHNITIDGESSFDSLDLRTNVNIQEIRWDRDYSRSYQTGIDTGTSYMNIVGLDSLKRFDKSSDFLITELVMNSLPSLEELYISSVEISEINCDSFPNLQYLMVDNFIQRLIAKNSSKLIKIERHKNTDLPYQPTYVEIGNCPNLYYVNFERTFRPDSVVLYDLPKHQDKSDGWSYSLANNEFGENQNLVYLEIRNVKNIESMKLYENDATHSLNSLKKIIIDSVDISDENFLEKAMNLEEANLNNTKLKKLNLHNSSMLSSCDVTQNNDLECVRVADLTLAKTSSNYQKEDKATWSEAACEDVQSINLNHLLNYSMSPNPSTGRFLLSGQLRIDKVTVYDQSGRLVQSINPSIDQKQVEVQLEKSGIYFIHVQSGGATQVLKSVVVM